MSLHWNGTAWKRAASPKPASLAQVNVLYGVAATPAGHLGGGLGHHRRLGPDAGPALDWQGAADRRQLKPLTGPAAFQLLVNGVALQCFRTA